MGFGGYYALHALSEFSSGGGGGGGDYTSPKKTEKSENEKEISEREDRKIKKAIKNGDLAYLKKNLFGYRITHINYQLQPHYELHYFLYGMRNNPSPELLKALFKNTENLCGGYREWEYDKENEIIKEILQMDDEIIFELFSCSGFFNYKSDNLLFVAKKKGIDFIKKLVDKKFLSVDLCVDALVTSGLHGYKGVENDIYENLFKYFIERANKVHISKIIKEHFDYLIEERLYNISDNSYKVDPLIAQYTSLEGLKLSELMSIRNLSKQKFFTKELFKKLYEKSKDTSPKNEDIDMAFSIALKYNNDLIQMFYDNGFVPDIENKNYRYNFFKYAPKEQVKQIFEQTSIFYIRDRELLETPICDAIKDKDEDYLNYYLLNLSTYEKLEGYKELLLAIIRGEKIDDLIKLDPIANSETEHLDADYLFLAAVENRNIDNLKKIIEYAGKYHSPNNDVVFKEIIAKGDKEIFKLFIDAGVELSYDNFNTLVKQQNTEFIKMIIDKMQYKYISDNNVDPMEVLKTGNQELIKMIFDILVCEHSYLHYNEIKDANIENIKMLVKAGSGTYWAIKDAIKNDDIEVIEKLINAGGKVTDEHIEEAVRNGNVDIFNILYVNYSQNEIPALAYAIKKGTFNFVKTLIERGANLLESDGKGSTIYQYARIAEDEKIGEYVKKLVIRTKINAVKTKIKSLFTRKDDKKVENNEEDENDM